ncbi:MAG: hypothetical protein BWZ10_02956 [candidate division BRC1 bacterium ADurb.BinA364]|nr:MAG: hypothetical protein BWZ10_02956 [candidate division BRC1 bacterium ADurb.BinA364]
MDSGVFYIPVAGDGDKQIIQTARKNGIKANRPFYEKYHAPLLAGVRSLAQQKNLTIADQVSLFGWLVIQTHNANNIGYLWGGDLLDGPSASGSTSGIGYDCSGYFWSVWEAIAPESVFANGGVRLDSRSYLNFGRCVIDSRKVDQSYIDDLIKKARPGDAIIDPNGHIMLYGYDPRTRDRTPIVMENGEFWNPLDKWLLRNKGKRLETRSTFAEDGSLLVKSGERKTPGRALPPMATPAREPSLVASASPGAGKPIARPGAGAMPEYESAPPEFVEDEIAALLLQLLSYEAFDTESLPPPSKANARPRIVAVRAPAAQLPNSALRFAVQAEDSDGDAIVQYRIRPRGTSQWILCDRAYFQTSMPGYAGPAMMEFQVMDARGAFSESTFRQIEVY